MRDAFSEFYAPTGEDLKRFLTDGVVSLDANILLGLYELATPQRDEVLTALDAVSDRLWLTHQAGLEYQRNRMRVIRSQAGAYRALQSLHGLKSVAEMTKALADKPLPDDVREAVEPLLIGLHEKLQAAAAEYTTAVSDLTSRHVVTAEEGLTGDPVRARLDTLFDGRVGASVTDEVRAERVKESVKRYADETPPGYKDNDKATPEDAAGDYLIWAELLDHAATVDKPFLFVTLDEKPDWFEKSGGNSIGPRVELVREFATHNHHGYHQVTLPDFLTLTNRYLQTDVPAATIERTGEINGQHVKVDYAFSPGLRSFYKYNTPGLETPDLIDFFRRSSIKGLDLKALRESGKLIHYDLRRSRDDAGVNYLGPDWLRLASGQRGVDPELLKRIVRLAQVDPELYRTIFSNEPLEPEDVDEYLRAIGQVEDPNDIDDDQSGESESS